ncbi:patatin-like phospholipase family protein [Simiduia aestuariiviva]|uniref:Patatin-like phospholipase family protein n=1 Tax=Simiduia aestuariiviva TaxID=1510459 RepID=A0A839UM25_9GAMM|nr:patatin-like phospholipase family protein [Simiduia aestuariiviva]MBB3167610.1 hypothetical protein [Simiduia aestuariiviva]
MAPPPFELLAGPSAYRHILQNGLSPQDIRSVFGASGAAKWLTIYGLDRAIFEQWLPAAEQQIHLFGTSIGAWKLAAAGQSQPGWALNELAEGYIEQNYADGITQPVVHRELMKILNRFLMQPQVDDLLSQSRFNYHCGVARCHGALSQDTAWPLLRGMSSAFVRNLRGRQRLNGQFERVIFADPRRAPSVASADGISTEVLSLSSSNLRDAVIASGSIPYVMAAKTAIAQVPPGVYRDGGLVDYHPVPANFWREPGLILYPHFYRWLLPGWYDKYLPSRRASAAALDNVIMVAPTPAYVASLPAGRIPDRKDFQRFKDNDAERVRRWRIVKEQSLQLGEAFMQVAQRGDWAAVTRSL